MNWSTTVTTMGPKSILGTLNLKSRQKLELATTLHENSVYGSYDNVYTTKYSCTDDKCNFDVALSDIGNKYPQFQSMVKEVAKHQDVVSAPQVKNIILHDAMDHIIVLHHDGGEQHKYNAFVNVNCFK